jgi:hypothetical protein
MTHPSLVEPASAAAYCTRCREAHPIIGGKFACPQPARVTGDDRIHCGFVSATIDLNPAELTKPK